MTTIKDILKIYHSQIDYLDLELLIAHELKKSREFVLAHPEHRLTPGQKSKVESLIKRRLKHEPLAYILGHKEFFGLDFKVDRHTLIPRPETELMVEEVLKLKPKNKTLVDVGTGSGNIIIALAKNISPANEFYATDISAAALKIARQNARLHKVDKKIRFFKGSLLAPILKSTNYKLKTTDLIILANLPYLSKKIYAATGPNVKKFEPRSALFSPHDGLEHYEKLLLQIKNHKINPLIFLEISPEQKPKITTLIRSILPAAKPEFFRDLAGKWRLCKIAA